MAHASSSTAPTTATSSVAAERNRARRLGSPTFTGTVTMGRCGVPAGAADGVAAITASRLARACSSVIPGLSRPRPVSQRLVRTCRRSGFISPE